ncbi:TRAP transporter small permease [Desulfotalea psychrophila]|uniref:Probable DctQ (C4-dicarboxylate permease, small subunit) n=1 Tax=Desulfotalea psychrophila (strain LSv54 / DSM 12343) TaxID=177439 RepID=Q6AN34_DESPS|nr:TRAP transporter small permease [Desulfotalea psychrophila]CAG36240.1 probable DctQ (C4-dicarboxylate permease, small subunit) [Desulfotalea psychrophila LSv54]
MGIIPKSKIPNIEMLISSGALVVMTVITVVQVFNRYVLQNSLDWSEELARYLFIWAVYVGCSYAVYKDRHLEVTILRTICNGKFARSLTLLSLTLNLLFCIFVTVVGIKFVLFLASTGQKTPALEISAYWVYLSMPFGFGMMGLRVIERIWWIMTGKIDPTAVDIIKE